MEPIDEPRAGDVPETKRQWSKPTISTINGPVVVKAHTNGKIVVMDDAGETAHYRNPS